MTLGLRKTFQLKSCQSVVPEINQIDVFGRDFGFDDVSDCRQVALGQLFDRVDDTQPCLELPRHHHATSASCSAGQSACYCAPRASQPQTIAPASPPHPLPA